MKAILTLSLGGTYPAPPSTRRGTIARPTAATAVCARNLRREDKRREKVPDRVRFFTVPPRLQLANNCSLSCHSREAMIYYSVERRDYSISRTQDDVKFADTPGRNAAAMMP